MLESKNICTNYLSKFSVNLDGIGHTVETRQSDESQILFLSSGQ